MQIDHPAAAPFRDAITYLKSEEAMLRGQLAALEDDETTYTIGERICREEERAGVSGRAVGVREGVRQLEKVLERLPAPDGENPLLAVHRLLFPERYPDHPDTEWFREGDGTEEYEWSADTPEAVARLVERELQGDPGAVLEPRRV